MTKISDARSVEGAAVESPKLVATGISHAYSTRGHTRTVLRSVDISVRPNDSLALIGTTGVGKSTLLRLLAGFEKPTEGEVRINIDGELQTLKPSVKIGYLFQQPNLFPWLTVAENAMFGARFGKVYRDMTQAQRVVDRLLSEVGLDKARHLYPYQISGGMRARTALARVFATQPQVLLMDEPFGALDALTRRDMYVMLRALISSQTELTSVLITHDVDEAIMLCNRIAVMSGAPGRVTAVIASDYARRREPTEVLEQESEYVALKAEIHKRLAH